MVALNLIRQSNARIGELPEGLVALFLGATSGIGESALRQFAQRAVRPRIYIAARRESVANELVHDLRRSNPEGTYTVILKDVSLVRETGEIVDFVKSKETKLDLLYMSMGFNSFVGRQETAEGLDGSMSTRYYSRIRAAVGLVPLLKAAAHPRVVSILAGGMEGKMNEDDLDLKKPGNFSIGGAAGHSATMQTLVLERLATENPEISFVHAFPGAVPTSNFTKGSSGAIGLVMRFVVSPLIHLLGMLVLPSVEDAGARALFYGTSDRYAVSGGSIPTVEGLEKASRSGGGVFLVNDKSDSVGDEELLGDFRRRGVDAKVWDHTTQVFEAISSVGN